MKGRIFIAAASALAIAGPASARLHLPDSLSLTAQLSGASEVPGPGDPDGGGTFSATLVRKSGQLCYELKVEGIEPATAAHIHVGRSHEADEVVATLATPDAEGNASACMTLGDRLTRHIMLVPDRYYVNVHTADFPAGAIRGQLTP